MLCLYRMVYLSEKLLILLIGCGGAIPITKTVMLVYYL